MKKLLGLFLILVTAGGIAFGQISVTSKFGIWNIGKAYDIKSAPNLAVVINAAGEKDIGPGNLHLTARSIMLGLHYQDYPHSSLFGEWLFGDEDYNFLAAGYTIPVGPGNLDFSLEFRPWRSTKNATLDENSNFRSFRPSITYSGINLGPATLSFELWYILMTSGMNKKGEKSFFGKGVDTTGTGYGINADELGFNIIAEFDFGLTVEYGFSCGFYNNMPGYYGGSGQKAGVTQLAYFNFTYAINDALSVNLEFDRSALWDENDAKWKFFQGFSLKPGATYMINDSMSVGLWIKFEELNNWWDGAARVEPCFWFKYIF